MRRHTAGVGGSGIGVAEAKDTVVAEKLQEGGSIVFEMRAAARSSEGHPEGEGSFASATSTVVQTPAATA